jgi:RNA polymerase sigma-70 factor (ECF subfamily)
MAGGILPEAARCGGDQDGHALQNAAACEGGSGLLVNRPATRRHSDSTRVSSDQDQQQPAADDRFVRALVRRLVADPHLADDIAQETWLAAIRHTAGGGRLTRGWLSTVARNFVLQTLRGDLRRRRRETIVAMSLPGYAADHGTIELDVRARVLAAVGALDPANRDVIRLRFYDDLMPTQIAERLQLPVETVRTRLKRGLARLGAALRGP